MTNDKRKGHLVSEPNYHTNKMLLGKSAIYLGLSILDRSKIPVYEY